MHGKFFARAAVNSFDLHRNFFYVPAFVGHKELHGCAIFIDKNHPQEAELVSQDQFETWTQQWRTAVEGGSEDTMLEFFSREKGVTDEQFLKQLADALKWPFVDLQSLSIASEIRSRISTKVAFQYGIMPAFEEDGVLLIAVSNPFTAGMLNAVQYGHRALFAMVWQRR